MGTVCAVFAYCAAMYFVLSYLPKPVSSWSDPNALAGECREAGLAFLDGVLRGWDKSDLAAWLTGPYHRVTQRRGERVTNPALFTDQNLVAVERLEELMLRARVEVVTTLSEASRSGGSIVFVGEAIRRGGILPTRTSDDADAWAPVDVLRMRLTDRVLSLFAADYLIRPVDYASDLVACLACGAVAFDATARSSASCRAHRRPSGFTFSAVAHVA
jgi:hypothetical protein